jgi:hypothetical protein
MDRVAFLIGNQVYSSIPKVLPQKQEVKKKAKNLFSRKSLQLLKDGLP